MNKVQSIIIKLGQNDLAKALGCGSTNIINAGNRGKFPSSWHPTVLRIAREKGIQVPDRLFSWKRPSDVAETDREPAQ